MAMGEDHEYRRLLTDDTAVGEVVYLSNGAHQRQKVTSEQKAQIAEAGHKFIAATGGNTCMIISGRLISQPGRDSASTEGAIAQCCLTRFGYPAGPLESDETIDLILDTLGGPLDSAFKSVLFLSRFTKRLRVFVPRRAKSAGTLIAIGASELYMSPFGELGPLDTQIRDPRNPTDRVSALDCYQSVDYVRGFGLSTLGKALWTLATETQTQIPLAQLVKTSADFSIGSVTPILSQVNALDFGGWGRTLKIGEMYAQSLLARVGYSQKDAEAIASQLVYGYTHHPFPIDLDEASRIGLNPMPMTREQYDFAQDLLTACHGLETLVGFTDDTRTGPGRPAGEHGIRGPVTIGATADGGTSDKAVPAKAVPAKDTRAVGSIDEGEPEDDDRYA
jgi:hypothetical protein